MASTPAELESRAVAAVDDTTWRYLSGTTDIDDSAQTETTSFNILTIEPQANSPLLDCRVWVDLAKATTGFAAVETSITASFYIARKVDGTNWRRQTLVEAALSGTLAATRMMEFNIGHVSVDHDAAIFVTFSSDVTGDMELPYVVAYRGAQAPTITAVAA